MIFEIITDVLVGIWVGLVTVAAVYSWYIHIIPKIIDRFERKKQK